MRLLIAVFTTMVFCWEYACAAQPQLHLPDWGKLIMPLHRHGSVVVQDRLYLIGGATEAGWIGTVISAPIGENGALGEWRSERTLPEARGYLTNSVATHGTNIYVVGGNYAVRQKTPDNELRKCADVLWTRVRADGRLEDWRRACPFPSQPLSCVAACVADGHLVAVGGSSNAGPVTSVLVSRIQPDGAPGDWVMTNPLPEKNWFHSATYAGGRLYVWGGLNERERSRPSSKTWSAAFARGLISGSWREDASLPRGIYASACAGNSGQLLCIGGRYAHDYPSTLISFGQPDPSGVLRWSTVMTNLKSRLNHAAAVDGKRGVVYISGGNDSAAPGTPGQILSDVQAFKIN